MGRIKEISRKSAHTRKRNPVVYLICEGSETEIRYFKRFRSRGCNIDIIPISSQYKSADRLVQKAKATMGNNPYYPEDGDSIWCVFDRDDNSYSNPSFELWFLLHFVNQQTEVEDCQALIRLLKQPKRIPDYEKNKDCFDVLKPLQAAAIQRAKARTEQVRSQGIEPISRQSNPLTTVWELVKYLNSKI
ncbi:MAG: RloB domain-containing protein [Subdoligranulum variabile]|nr:RloB domain-containing protein [Subdoligranulum variabile]